MTTTVMPDPARRLPVLQQRPPNWMIVVRCLALMGLVGLLAPVLSLLILGVYLWLMLLPVVLLLLGVPAATLQWRWLQPAVSRWRFVAALTVGSLLGAVLGFVVMLAADEAWRNLYTTLLTMALMSTLAATAAQTLLVWRVDRAHSLAT
jgi:hypothetical protein